MVSIPAVADAKAEGTPALVYFFIRGADKSTGKKADALAKIAKQCAKVESKYFRGLDSKIGILSKLFACTRMDITGVMPNDNRCINAAKAPLVLLVSANGKKKITLSAKQITKSSLLSSMTNILKASGCDASKILRQSDALLARIRKAEDKKGLKSKAVISADKMLAYAKKRMATLEAKGKNKTADLVKVKRAELKKKAAEAELEKAEKVLSPFYDKLNKILENSKIKMGGSLDSSSES